ncbi:MAG: peptide transporter [Acetobacteraceae bacterium]|nr:peptide transporter [Acetobacteraceae bacterium]
MAPTALHVAHSHLLASRFAAALAAVAPIRGNPSADLLYALALAGIGEVEAAAPLLAAIAAANAKNRHPVLDLLPLLPAAAAPAHLRAAAARRPHDPALPAALATILAEIGPMDEALEAFRRVVALAPAEAAGWSNLGKALAATAQFEAAEAAFQTARRLTPGDARIAYNQAITLLKAGRYAEGWPALKVRHALPGRPPPLPGRRLTDLDIAGRTVLLRHEEGFGDTLQFIRFAPLLADRGARVIAAVPPGLRSIVATVPGLKAVHGMNDLPRYDLWAPLLDVPALFVDAVPANTPYFRAGPPSVALPGGRRVGLVWAGDGAMPLDRQRSLPLDALAPLAERRDITWISLQKGRPAPPWMFDPMSSVQDFADTAAIVAQLDAVVSVDTAVAHLAGALGKSVVLLDRYDNCWRWLSGRTDSPWYPRLRIVRQSSPGDWAGVIAALPL